MGAVVAILYLALGPGAELMAGAFHDDAVYLSLGKALASGQGYHSIYTAGDPVHLKYPPGIPALYAMFWLMAGDLDGVMLLVRLGNLVAVGLSAAMIWWLARHRFQADPLPTAVLALGPLMLDSTVYYFSIPLSEPYFLTGWLAVLVWYYRWRDGRPGTQIRAAVVTGLLVAVTMLIRIQGLVLLPAILGAAVWDRRERRSLALFGAAGILPPAGWALWHSRLMAEGPVSTQPDEMSYLDYAMPSRVGDAADLLSEVVTTNLVRYLGDLSFLLGDVRWLGFVLAISVGLAVLAGAALQIRKLTAPVLSLAASAVTVLAWPFTQDRLLIPLLPVAGIVLAVQVSDWIKSSVLTRTLAAGALVLATVSVTLRQVHLRQADPAADTGRPSVGQILRRNSEFLRDVSAWVEANTASSDIILTEPAPGIFLHTGRKSVTSSPPLNFVRPRESEELGKFLAGRILEDGVDVLIVGNLTGPMAAEVAGIYRDCRGSLAFVSTPGLGSRAAVYRVTEDRACLAGIIDP